jgi:DNA-directed RNA polymerase specialized sigma subunit
MNEGWKLGAEPSAEEVKKRRKAIMKLRAKKIPLAEIARRLGVSRQRVSQIVAEEEKRAGEIKL